VIVRGPLAAWTAFFNADQFPSPVQLPVGSVCAAAATAATNSTKSEEVRNGERRSVMVDIDMFSLAGKYEPAPNTAHTHKHAYVAW
jgi:hypothetical protein